MKTYKGIEIENAEKRVTMAHSRFFGRSEGVDCLAELLDMRKAGLTAEQFEAMSALSSVANMNYQICNGGLYQYYFNGYNRERAPFSPEDVKQLDKDAQVEMLRELLRFGKAIFPERELENERLDRVISEFEEAYYEEPCSSWDDEDYDEYDTGLEVAWGFDDRYYEVNEHIEALMELYAQYLLKRFSA